MHTGPAFRNRRPPATTTQIHNSMLRDPRMSAKAKGLLALMLSFPDGWTYYQGQLSTMMSDGRDAIRTGIIELEALGYLRRGQRRNTDGTLANVVMDVTDQAGVFGDAVDCVPDGIRTADGFSGAGESNTSKSSTYSQDQGQDQDQSQELLSTSSTIPPKPRPSAREVAAPAEGLRGLLAVWNDNCGKLPKAQKLTPARATGLARLLKTCGSLAEAKVTLRKATVVVAGDDFWNRGKYGLDNLLAGDKYMQRAEQYVATEEAKGLIPSLGDRVRIKIQVGAMKTEAEGDVTETLEKQVVVRAEFEGIMRSYRVPHRDVLAIL